MFGEVKAYIVITVEFLGPIDKDPLTMEAETLEQLAAKLAQDPKLKPWLKKCAVAINDTMVSEIGTKLKDGDRVSLLPPVCGG